MLDIEKYPKIELHCHLDGSLSMETIKKIIPKDNLPDSDKEIEYLLKVSHDCKNLSEYLEKFQLPLLGLQTKKNLEYATYNIIKDVSKENVKYIEIRFAPALSSNDNLSMEEVINSVVTALKKAEKDFKIYTNCIVCAMRQLSFEENSKMLKIAKEYLGNGVCALDLAGDEIRYPTKNHIDLFKLAKDMNFPYTLHSGETGNVENVALAVELGAKRLGHGIALGNDKTLMNIVKSKNIGIEMCPTSNIQTKSIENYDNYPMLKFLKNDMLVSVNTDNRTVSNTTLTKELGIVQNLYGNEVEDLMKKVYTNSVITAFADDSVKDYLIRLQNL